MNPFDQAPATPPVSFDPPNPLIQPAPRRGRMVLVALAAAGLVGAGLVGVSQFASADRPQIDPNATGDTLIAPDTDQDGSDQAEPDDADDAPAVDGQIVIDDGDGEPIVIDLGEGTVDGQPFEQIAECLGLPLFEDGEFATPRFPSGELPSGEFPFDELESMFEDFPFEDFPFEDFGGFEQLGDLGAIGPFGADGTHVTVIGPDGLSVVELGDGDGSVTITQQDGEVTIATEGSATVNELDEMLGAIELPDLESLDLEQILPDGFPDRFEFELPDVIQDCLDPASGG
jgi:hypothetical protein